MLFKNFIYNVANTLNREFRRIRTDRTYLIGSVGVMAFCFIFFLTFFEEGQPQNIPVAVVDNDQSSLSRQYVRNLKLMQHVSVHEGYLNYSEAHKAMQSGDVYAIVVVNDGFAAETLSGRQPTIHYYVNDAFLVAGSLVLKDISYITELTNGGVKQKTLQARGYDNQTISGIIQPIVLDAHLLANPWANYGVYLLNNLLPGVLQIMVLMLTVYSIGTELKLRTSAEWLATANNSMPAALLGKVLPYTLLFTILGFISNILLYQLMDFPLHNSITRMFLASFLMVISYQAIAVMICGIVPVLRDSVTLAALYGLFGLTFAGFTFAIEQMPYYLQIFSYFFPIRYYFLIYVRQALYGLSVDYSFWHYVAFTAFLLLPLLTAKRLKNAAILQNYPVK
ncbi:MAG: ABC transporter permease [Paludibacter sp.]